MADGLDVSGDVILELAEIITVSGTTADITEVVSYIEIFEDIQNPLLQGSISFTDSVNLKDLGPLVGQELLKLKIRTPSLEAEWEVIESLFVLYDLVNTTEINQNNNMHNYKFISLEGLENNRIRISRALRDTFSEMVRKILRFDLKCEKDIRIEDSSGIHQLIGNEMPPLNLISAIKQRATSKELGSPTYLFFETLEGFHFRTLESLYVGSPVQSFIFSSEGGHSPKNKGFSNALIELNTVRELTLHTTVNNLDATYEGNYSSQVIEHDIFNKTVTHHNPYNYFDSFKNEKHINSFHGKPQFPFLSDVSVETWQNRESDFNTKRYVCPVSYSDASKKYDSHYTDIGGDSLKLRGYSPESWLPKRTSWMQNFDGIAAEITIDGNTSLRAGENVLMDLPPSALVRQLDKTKPDRVYNGPFLIRNIKHKFIFTDNGNTHTMNMTIVKDCVDSDMESSDMTVVPDFYGKSIKVKPHDIKVSTKYMESYSD